MNHNLLAGKKGINMNCQVNKVTSQAAIQRCFDIRIEVFVKGQNVPFEEDLDEKDALSDHYLLSIDDEPAGTARVRLEMDFAKIERVAILAAYQGRGYGNKLMKTILDDVKANTQISKAKLSAQVYCIAFYENLGFSVCSEEYMDAGIPHKDMQLRLR